MEGRFTSWENMGVSCFMTENVKLMSTNSTQSKRFAFCGARGAFFWRCLQGVTRKAKQRLSKLFKNLQNLFKEANGKHCTCQEQPMRWTRGRVREGGGANVSHLFSRSGGKRGTNAADAIDDGATGHWADEGTERWGGGGAIPNCSCHLRTAHRPSSQTTRPWGTSEGGPAEKKVLAGPLRTSLLRAVSLCWKCPLHRTGWEGLGGSGPTPQSNNPGPSSALPLHWATVLMWMTKSRMGLWSPNSFWYPKLQPEIQQPVFFPKWTVTATWG